MKLGSARLGPLAVACVAAGCTEAAPSPFTEDLFEVISEVALEEPADDPIIGVGLVARRPGGGFALADERADRVRLFDSLGVLEASLGSSGDGPGELDAPTAVVEFSDGQLFVTQRSNPRVTVFGLAQGPRLIDLPGHYGDWAASLGERLVVGMGSRAERFAVMSRDGEVLSSFGLLPAIVNEIPYWIYFARQHAAVLDDRVVTNTSFMPTLRLFDPGGDSVGVFGHPPPSWIPSTEPPVDRMENEGDRARLEEWARSFTVVRGVASIGDSLVVVQYGRHDPRENEPYYVVPTTIDVYGLPGGDKLAEDVPLREPIVGGGEALLVLSSQPPEAWTLSVLRWRGVGR